jgi:hypothetical protein
MKSLTILACLALLTACAGRDAKPVAMMSPYDRDLSCEQIEAEIQNNEAKAQQLAEEDNSAHNSNVAIGVVGALLFWPALFALDVSDAERVEIEALHDRNMHLATLQRDCSTVNGGGGVQSARAVKHGAYDGKWVVEGPDDGCGSPYAMEINVQGGEAKGLLWRGKAEYNFQGTINQDGKIEKLLAGKTAASNGIVGPRYITVNTAFEEGAASGDYSMAAPGAGTCTVAVNLSRHQA